MEHNDFENLFKNQLEELSPNDFPFEEGAWDDVESTLNDEGILLPQKRKWGGILPISILLLLMSNGLVGWKYFSAEQEVSTLQEQLTFTSSQLAAALTQVKNAKPTVPFDNNSADDNLITEAKKTPSEATTTSPQIKIVERIVKRFIEVPVEKIVERIVYVPVNNSLFSQNPLGNKVFSDENNSNIDLSNPLSNHSFSQNITPNSSKLKLNYSNDDGYISENIDKYLFPSSGIDVNNPSNNNPSSSIIENNDASSTNLLGENKTTSIEDNTASPKENQENTNTERENIEENIDLLDLIDLANLEAQSDTINTNDIEAFILDNPKRKLSFGDYLGHASSYVEVSNYELGVLYGFDFLYQGNDFNPSNTRAGITGELRFSDYIKLGTSLEWRASKGELEDIQDRTITDIDQYYNTFPSLTGGLSPDDVLTKIEYYDNAIEFSLFAKYLFTPKKTWTPYIGAGLRGEYDYEQRFEYKFLQAPDFVTDYELDYVYFYNKQFGFNTLTLMTGMEYQLHPNFAFKVDAFYNYDYQAHRFDNSKYQWFSGNVGLLYKFRKTPINRPPLR